MAINAHTFKLNLKDQQESKENPTGNPNDLLGNLKQETKTTTDNIKKGGSVSDNLEDYSLSQNEMEEILLQGDLKVIQLKNLVIIMKMNLQSLMYYLSISQRG